MGLNVDVSHLLSRCVLSCVFSSCSSSFACSILVARRRVSSLAGDVVLPTDDWKAETGDIQLAILASLGLLDDYEAEEADITLNSLPRNEDLYTIKYKPEKKKPNIPRGHEIFLEDDTDWELVLRSPSEGSMDWIMLEE